jgi:hypothetical protein
MYTKKISPKDWFTKSGYVVEIRTKTDKQAEDIDNIQKLDAAMGAMPTNVPLMNIRKKKLLEFADLPPDEINTVLEFEKQQEIAALLPGSAPGMPGANTPTGNAGQSAGVGQMQPLAQVPPVVAVPGSGVR